jgi:hypothetical protein
MQTTIPTLGTNSWARRLMPAAPLVLFLVFGLAQTGLAQTDPPLYFGNNFFVTGDYVVGGVGLRGMGDSTGYATGYIKIPDANWTSNTGDTTGVPLGAAVVAAFLYWQTVESSSTVEAGKTGFFGPAPVGGQAHLYSITGDVLGNPNAPVSWSSGGCSGSSQGSKTMRTYRADVSSLLPVDSQGNVLADGRYEVQLTDSGSNGGGAPLTLGATLVIIYRILDKGYDNPAPLKSVIIYDGSYAPSNSSSTMTQTIRGFYQPASSPISRLTHIVGNGQSNKYETVVLGSLLNGATLNSVNLPSLYGSQPTFPGYYNGDWDNPTWNFPNAGTNPVLPNADAAFTEVMPSSSNSGCVSWGAVILSTTVKDTDKDGLLDKWEQDGGYCDASLNGGVCKVGDTTDPGWVPLPGASPSEKDIFVQMDYMCSAVNLDGTCDPANSLLPKPEALSKISDSFSAQGINLHLIPTNIIPETTCTDDLSASPPKLCPYPNQPGVVGWKGGFGYYKNQPLNYPDESSCEAATDPPCMRRFQHGKKDSYHYALFGHALGVANWSLLGGNLSVVESGNTVTFTTSTPNGLIPDPSDSGFANGRVTVSDAITNPNLNGTFLVQTVSGNSFTINITCPPSPPGAPCPTGATPFTLSTDPNLSVGSGQAGTISGASDVGGQDSADTLASWGDDGQGTSAQAGTFMHELGHSLGLTHGGFYYDHLGDPTQTYFPTLGANCKPNYQSVMSYFFQVDLLDGLDESGNPEMVPDYSEQSLTDLNETSLSPLGVTTTDSSNTAYLTTKWYSTNSGGAGTPATIHCDGTPKSPTDPDMYRLIAPVPTPTSPSSTIPITWASSSNPDINFDGSSTENLRGYDDWSHVDLQQIGATGNVSTVGLGIGRAGLGIGRAGLGIGRAGLGIGRAGLGIGRAGLGTGEITRETANSVTRPPRNLTASIPTKGPTIVNLSWEQPTFGQIGTYNIYRGVDGAAPTVYGSVVGTPPTTTFTDSKVSCGHTYDYFVTAVLAGTSQESVPSNTKIVIKCAVQ